MKCLMQFIACMVAVVFIGLTTHQNLSYADEIADLKRKLEYLENRQVLDSELELLQAQIKNKKLQINKLESDYQDVITAAPAEQTVSPKAETPAPSSETASSEISLSIAAPDAAEESEAVSWALAEESGSPGEYERYLADFPNGICSELAQERVEETRSWEKVRDTSDLNLLKQHIKKHPYGRVTKDAVKTMEQRFVIHAVDITGPITQAQIRARFYPLVKRKDCSIRQIDVAELAQENLPKMTPAPSSEPAPIETAFVGKGADYEWTASRGTCGSNRQGFRDITVDEDGNFSLVQHNGPWNGTVTGNLMQSEAEGSGANGCRISSFEAKQEGEKWKLVLGWSCTGGSCDVRTTLE